MLKLTEVEQSLHQEVVEQLLVEDSVAEQNVDGNQSDDEVLEFGAVVDDDVDVVADGGDDYFDPNEFGDVKSMCDDDVALLNFDGFLIELLVDRVAYIIDVDYL